MARQLRDVGEAMSDVAIMAKILGSLPSKYSALITAWDSVNPEMQTIQALQERLIKEETRLAADDDTNALATIRRRSRRILESRSLKQRKKFQSASIAKRRDILREIVERRSVMSRTTLKQATVHLWLRVPVMEEQQLYHMVTRNRDLPVEELPTEIARITLRSTSEFWRPTSKTSGLPTVVHRDILRSSGTGL